MKNLFWLSRLLFLYILLFVLGTLVFVANSMGDEESVSTSPSAIASALASGATSPAQSGLGVNPKSTGLLEEAVPMVIVQQFIEDNKEKGMPVNQKMADLKKQAEEIKIEKKRVAKELKNEERKRQRLRAKAKQLSAEDLVQVLALRASASASRKSKKNQAAKAAAAPKQNNNEEVDDE